MGETRCWEIWSEVLAKFGISSDPISAWPTNQNVGQFKISAKHFKVAFQKIYN